VIESIPIKSDAVASPNSIVFSSGDVASICIVSGAWIDGEWYL